MAKVEKFNDGKMYGFFCPGCECYHIMPVVVDPERNGGKHPVWGFNGDVDRPTFTPSIRCRGRVHCHSFVRDGKIQFLSDCDHGLAGKTMGLPDVG